MHATVKWVSGAIAVPVIAIIIYLAAVFQVYSWRGSSRSSGTSSADRRRLAGWLLLAAAAWTVFIWVNRLVNLAGDDRSAGFVAVHVVLAVVSLALAVPVAIVGWHLRASRSSAPPPMKGT